MVTYPSNIDSLISTYDFHNDKSLDAFTPIFDDCQNRIKQYGINSNTYGLRIIQPHLLRVSHLAKRFLIDVLNYDEVAAENVFQANLLQDFGKTHESCLPRNWTLETRAPDEIKEQNKWHTIRGVELLDEVMTEHKLSKELIAHPHVQVTKSIMNYHHEQHNGQGRHEIAGADLGQVMPVICLFDAYDGDLIFRPHQDEPRTVGIELDRLQEKPKYQGAFTEKLLKQLVEFKATIKELEEFFEQDGSTARQDLIPNPKKVAPTQMTI